MSKIVTSGGLMAMGEKITRLEHQVTLHSLQLNTLAETKKRCGELRASMDKLFIELNDLRARLLQIEGDDCDERTISESSDDLSFFDNLFVTQNTEDMSAADGDLPTIEEAEHPNDSEEAERLILLQTTPVRVVKLVKKDRKPPAAALPATPGPGPRVRTVPAGGPFTVAPSTKKAAAHKEPAAASRESKKPAAATKKRKTKE